MTEPRTFCGCCGAFHFFRAGDSLLSVRSRPVLSLSTGRAPSSFNWRVGHCAKITPVRSRLNRCRRCRSLRALAPPPPPTKNNHKTTLKGRCGVFLPQCLKPLTAGFAGERGFTGSGADGRVSRPTTFPHIDRAGPLAGSTDPIP